MKTKGELKHLLHLGAPVAAAQLANMAMQIVDMLFVGRLGPTAIAGVGAGNAVFATFMIVGVGLLLGLDYLASHAFGAGRVEECHDWLIQGCCLATLVALPMTIIMLFSGGFFSLVGIAPDVAPLAAVYLRSVCLSLWPLLLFMAFRQYLQAMGVAMPVLLILVVGNLINALCNWVFIFGHWGFAPRGVVGAGIATTVARVLTLAVIVWYALRQDKRLGLNLKRSRLQISRKKLGKLMRLGGPAGLQILFEVGAFAGSTLLAGRLGAIPLAAHQIVLNVASVTFMVPLGLGAASAVRVGQSLGAGQQHRAVRIGWLALGVGAVFMTVSGLSLYFLNRPILSGFTKVESVLEIGKHLLLIAALFQLSDGVQVVAAGVLRGAADTRSSMLANFAGHWLLGLPTGYVLCFAMGWGVTGLWVGLSIGLTFVALVLTGVWWAKAKKIA
jgi:MATE family multidrug resistance protein